MNRLHPLLLTLLALAACSKSGGPPPGAFAVAVRTAPAERRPLEEKISLVASLSANESVDVQSKIEGTIERIAFDEGQEVEKGRLLFQLDTTRWSAALAQAEANLTMMKSNRDRAESMWQNRTISQQEYDQAVANYDVSKAAADVARQQLKDAKIYAEFEGIVGARMVSVGQVVQPQTVLTRLVDLDPIKIEFHVPERFLKELQVGQSVEFRVPAYPGESFRGEVYFVDPQVDSATRTVLVKARTANADRRLRPGMFGNLDLITRVREDAILVPESALIQTAESTLLFVVGDDHTAQPRTVQTGLRVSGSVEIVAGLSGGEQVIVEGTQKVQPGIPVAAREAAGS